MDRETLRILAELSVATLALVVVVIFAYIILNRAKSDTNTIKVFADLITGSYKDIKDDVRTHGGDSTVRHGEVVLALQAVTTLLTKISNSHDEILKEVKEANQTGTNIMDKLTPFETTLQEIRDELRLLRAEVATRTDHIETRLIQVEKTATQETPQVEVSKPKPPGVPVTLKPTDVIKPDSGQEKTE